MNTIVAVIAGALAGAAGTLIYQETKSVKLGLATFCSLMSLTIGNYLS